MDLSWIDDLDGDAACDAVASIHRSLVESEAAVLALAAHWADLHGEDAVEFGDLVGADGRVVPGTEVFKRYGGDGNPKVGEFASMELGALQGISTQAADQQIRDALNLRHRHPRLWALVMAGRVRAWQAREITRRCENAGLDLEPARWVDVQVADKVGWLSYGKVLELVEAKIIEADPAQAQARRRAAELARFVRTGESNEHGIKTLIARAAAGDVVFFVAMVTRIAKILRAHGDTDPIEVLRSKAIGILAVPHQALTLLQTAGLPTTTSDGDLADDDGLGDDGVDAGSGDDLDDGGDGPADETPETTSGSGTSGSGTGGSGANDGSGTGGSDARVGSAVVGLGALAATGAVDLFGRRLPGDGEPIPGRHPDGPADPEGLEPTGSAPYIGCDHAPHTGGTGYCAAGDDCTHYDCGGGEGGDGGCGCGICDPAGGDTDPSDTDPDRDHREIRDHVVAAGDLHPGHDDSTEDRALCPTCGGEGTVTGDPAAFLRPVLSGDPKKYLPPATLYIHCSRESFDNPTTTATTGPHDATGGTFRGGGGGGVARMEGQGPITVDQAIAFLGHTHVTVKPVIDLADQTPVTSYEVPDRLREAVILARPVEVFPYGTQPARAADLDHTRPYVPPDHGGPPHQTNINNLGPLGRRHHRARTHGHWNVRTPTPGTWLWRSPHGRYWYHDHTGTHPLTQTLGDLLWTTTNTTHAA